MIAYANYKDRRFHPGKRKVTKREEEKEIK